jgi:hypothetical protein
MIPWVRAGPTLGDPSMIQLDWASTQYSAATGAGALRHIIADAAVRIVLLAEDKLQRLADALLGNGTTVGR